MDTLYLTSISELKIETKLMERVIIYPTDFSACAENALPFAIGMAQAMNCKLVAVHAIDIGGISASEESPARVLDDIKLLERKAEQQLRIIKDRARKSQIECKSEVIKGGRKVSFFSEYLEEADPLMVVMGTIGSGGLENMVMGSLTYKLIKNTTFPFLAVPEKATFNGLQKIIFASDYHVKDEDSIRFLVEIAQHFKAAIEVVHLFEGAVPDKGEQMLFNDFKKYISKRISYPKTDFKLLHCQNVDERLDLFLNESKGDLLALVTRKRNFIDHLFHVGITKKMIYHTHIPLLVFSWSI